MTDPNQPAPADQPGGWPAPNSNPPQPPYPSQPAQAPVPSGGPNPLSNPLGAPAGPPTPAAPPSQSGHPTAGYPTVTPPWPAAPPSNGTWGPPPGPPAGYRGDAPEQPVTAPPGSYAPPSGAAPTYPPTQPTYPTGQPATPGYAAGPGYGAAPGYGAGPGYGAAGPTYGAGPAGPGYPGVPGYQAAPVPVAAAVTRKRKGPRIAAAAIAATCLVGSGVFAYASLTGGDDGAATPEAAVEDFFGALSKEDAIGMLNTMPAGERRTLVPMVNEMVKEFSRLGVLDNGADPSKVTGIDLQFDNLTFDAKELSSTVATVTLTGGTVNGSYDLSKLPMGRELIEGAFDGSAPEGTDTSNETLKQGDFPDLVTVKDGEGWHVSLWYSVAEAARKDAGQPLPPFGQGVAAKGADSPEAAVEALFGAIGSLDVRRMIELTPPDEAAALHDYAPLFLDDAERSIDEMRADTDLELNIKPTDMTVENADGRKVVRVRGVTGSALSDGQEITFEVKDGCGTITSDGETRSGCLADLTDQDTGGGAAGELGDLAQKLGDPSIGIATVEVDGSWYVSPTFTLGGMLLDLLAGADSSDMRNIFDSVGEGMQGSVDLGSLLGGDVLGGVPGVGGGMSGFQTDDSPFGGGSSGSGSRGASTGYDRYSAACTSAELDIYSATNAAAWKAAVTNAAACAAPFLANRDVVASDLPDEVAHPDCYPGWPYEPTLTLAQQSALFTQIDSCLAKFD